MWWLREKSDLHIHRTTGKSPLDLFEEEELQPLPLHPYDTSEVALRVCDAEGFVAFETNRYSVPSDYIADILSIKATEHEILVYGPEIDLIARHERMPAGMSRKVENPNHFATKKVHYGLEPVREAFTALANLKGPYREASEKLRLPRPVYPPYERALRKRRHPQCNRARHLVPGLRRARGG